ncbi:hypothetical protein ACFFRR_002887 [Megaselia abdita]
MCSNLTRCCCFDLKTGTFIIGVLDLIFGIIGFWQAITTPSTNDEVVVGVIQKASIALGIVAAVLLIIGAQKEKPRFVLFWIIMKVIGLVVLALSIIMILATIAMASGMDIEPDQKTVLIITVLSLVIAFGKTYIGSF